MSGRRIVTLGCAVILLMSVHGAAQLTENLSIHGFGGWAAGMTDNENRFGFTTEEFELNDYYFSLNFSANPTDRLSINSQVYFGKELKWRNVGADSAYARTAQVVEVDYLFIQYSFSSLLGFRLGKVKSPFGIYAEVYDVGTLRPFYYLPFSVYKGLLPKSYYGLGLTGRHLFSPDFELTYDLVVGEIETQPFYMEDPIISVKPPLFQPELQGVTKLKYTPVGRDFFGGKVSITPYIEGLNIGISYMSFKGYLSVDDGPREEGSYDERLYAVLGHADYTVDAFNLKGEYYAVGGGDRQDLKGGYVETSYRVPDKWLLEGEFQVALQYEFYKNKTASVVENAQMAPSTLEHNSYGFGLNYWFNPTVVLKANFYKIEGNAYAAPLSVISTLFSGETLQEDTNVFIIGTQFSF